MSSGIFDEDMSSVLKRQPVSTRAGGFMFRSAFSANVTEEIGGFNLQQRQPNDSSMLNFGK